MRSRSPLTTSSHSRRASPDTPIWIGNRRHSLEPLASFRHGGSARASRRGAGARPHRRLVHRSAGGARRSACRHAHRCPPVACARDARAWPVCRPIRHVGEAAPVAPALMQRSADVVIVGSAYAALSSPRGSPHAASRSLILEAGSRVSRPAALAQYHAALIKVPECAYPNLPYAPHSTSDRPDSYYLHGGPDKFEATYLRQVGGTTWHWLGTSFRFIPDDFRLRSKFGVGVDWPISYEDLEPWYCEAEQELGVAGDPDARLDAPRSRPYPLPAIPLLAISINASPPPSRSSATRLSRLRKPAIRGGIKTVLRVAAAAHVSRSARCRRSTTRPCMSRRRSGLARS